MDKIMGDISKILSKHLKSSKQNKNHVLNQQKPELIASTLELKELLEKGFSNNDEILNFITNYLKNTNHLSNPNYMGHQVAVPYDLSGIPELIHGTINNPSSLYEMGPAGATCEGFMINWMLDKVGWLNGKDYYDFKFKKGEASGLLTHGGSIANMTALAAARSAISPEAWQEGNPKDIVVIGAKSAHYSISRALSILGLGSNSFLPVKVDKNEVLKMDDLEIVYNTAIKNNLRVMCVVANACATSTGLYDPISEMGDFCENHKLWFHIDGAHGAAALVSKKNKNLLKGINKATSIIWDAHKMMRVPALCTALLFKNFKHQALAFQQKGSYVFHEQEVVGMDSMPYTIECTKTALGTKFFWALALEGEGAIEKYIDYTFELAKYFYNQLKKEEHFELPYSPESNILCFRYVKESNSNEFQKKLRYSIIYRKKFYITSCEMNGLRYLRVVLLNPETSKIELGNLIEEIKIISKKLSNE
ncbi:aminotransferase class V-fold PLP-dependent enzyme [Flavobacteriaceae bacterium]|nr:aminotransferase class V-fold PLP-dependent enzyme [Flavobacteriaceae bacterium]